MLTADAQLDVGAGGAAFGDGRGDELTNTCLIEGGEGVLFEDLVLGVGHEEVAHIVPADAECGLSEVVGAEAEELSRLSDFICGQCSARHFDHRADEITELHFLFCHDLFRDTMHDFGLKVQFLLKANQRNHDFGFNLDLLLGDQGSGFKDSACLHRGDLWVGDAEAAATVTEHGVHFMQGFHAVCHLLSADAKFIGECSLLLSGLWKELMQRWVQQADGGRQTFELFKDAGKVFPLIRQEFAKGCFSIFFVVGKDHLAHGVDAVALKEHVFGAGEADADSAEGDGLASLLWSVCVGADIQAGGFATPFHELKEALEFLRGLSAFVATDHAGDDFRVSSFQLACIDGATGAIDGEVVFAFGEHLASDGDGLFFIVDLQSGGTADADLAHLAGDECGVGRHTAFGGEDAVSSDHAAKVFGAGFVADEEDAFAFGFGSGGAVGVEVDFAGSSAGACWQTGGDGFGFFDLSHIKDGGEQLVELIGRVAQDGGFPVDEFFLHHVHGELESGGGGALAVTSLEHEQFALLDGELDVLDVFEVAFENAAHFEQLGVRAWHLLFEFEHWLWGADAGDDVFTLGVDEELAVEFVGAVGWVTGEGDAGAGVVTGVAIDHGLDVDGGAPLGGDVVFAAIDDSAVIHPGAEDGAGGTTELVPDAVGEAFAGAFFDECLEAFDQFFLVVGGEVAIDDVLAIDFVFEAFDDDFERLVIFAFAFLDTEDDVAVHLDEAAVAIPSEAFVAGSFGQGDDGLVIEAEVEDGVHHARHGVARAGADSDEERHAFGVAKFAAHDALHFADALLHLSLEASRVGAFVGVVVGADFGADGEAWRHREADAAHFC